MNPWVNIPGVSARYNALMNEEFSLLEALIDINQNNGSDEDRVAILNMLIDLDSKADDIRLNGGVLE